MSELLRDPLNLELLENICSGDGVEVNISKLAKKFGKHRNTIQTQVKQLFENDIIISPAFPFMWLYKEYPLLVIARVDLPRNENIEKWLKGDEHIFAAFYVKEGDYNTLLVEYHKDLYEYGEWRKSLIEDGIIPPRAGRYPAQSLFFSNKHIFKHKPHYPIYKMEDDYKRGSKVEINGFEMSELCFSILKALMRGEGIRTNENLLSKKVNIHRRTIERRMSALLEEGIVSKPVCRFPRFFVPPNQFLTCTLLEVAVEARNKLIKAIMTDPSITMALESVTGRYSFLLFGAFANVQEHIEWEERYDKRFPNCIGAMKTTYLSPKMTTSIDQQKVSLGIIRKLKSDLSDG